jgi:hypothetical protein
MILPMLSKVWQVCAETQTLVEKAFGRSGNCTYVEDAAEKNVSSLLEVYTEYTLPLLSGPGHHMTGPFFLRAAQKRNLPIIFLLNRGPFEPAHQ